MLFAPFESLDLRAELSLSLNPSLESEFDFFKPLNTLKNSIALTMFNEVASSFTFFVA